jgi:type II secretory pathway pseudopilin PulG
MVAERRRRGARGYSIVELLVVLAFMGIVCVIGASVWINARTQTECTQAARLIKSFILEARMLSVYKGNDHFVVFDPATRVLSLFSDTHTPLGVYDAGDTRIRREALPLRATLSLPATPSPLASPLGTGNLASAWGIGLPDTSGAWGSNLRGVRATPTGQIETVEATPQTVTAGTIVLSDIAGNTVAVGVRGQMGSVRSFKLLGTVWGEL